MAGIRLKHVETWKDRRGTRRYYYRVGHGPRIPLEGEPGSREFAEDYARAHDGAKLRERTREIQDGTIAKLVSVYLASPKFKALKPVTQTQTRNILERFAAAHGTGVLESFRREHMDTIIGGMVDRPAAANVLLKKVRAMVRYGIQLKMLAVDPTLGVTRFKSGSFHSWTETEIAAFVAKWPRGTLQRAAFDLHLFTGQRRSDVCAMRWDQITKGVLSVVQGKTGAQLEIPLHPDLLKTLKATPRTGETIIGTVFGSQRSSKAYGNYMAEAIDKAGLPEHCVLHGLRKAAARRLAEAGCSANEIASITGHATLEEVSRYTKAAEQKKLAVSALERLKTSLGRGRKAK